MTKKDFRCFMLGLIAGSMITLMSFIFVKTSTAAEGKPQDSCKIYHDKAKELAEKSAVDLPPGITVDFDPRIANSNASIAYSQIYRNCKEYGK